MKHNTTSGTILVYTLVLVVLGVFMAIGILNLAQKLESDYVLRNIDIFLNDTLKSKSEVTLKFAKSVNNSGSGFVDLIGCPQDITLSGSTIRTDNATTSLQVTNGFFYCSGTHGALPFYVYFKEGYTDTFLLQYSGLQIPFSSTGATGLLGDADTTFVNGTPSFPLLPDGYDDNFDSDNYRSTATGGLAHPGGYIDNDTDARRFLFGYTLENSGWYNIFWSNDEMLSYINRNTNNNFGPFVKLSEVVNGHLWLDINGSFRLKLYQIDKNAYTTTNEIIALNVIESNASSPPDIGYLQNDMTLASEKTGNEYVFDFTSYDYSIFLQNTSSGTLLYQINTETNTGTGVYMVPIIDDDPAIISMLGSHMFLNETGLLIGTQSEIVQLK